MINLFFWIQGYNDYEYLNSISNIGNIELIPYSLKAYDRFLATNNVDYIGTRLHAGIYAIKHGIRSIIISIDNRSADMYESFKLPIINQNELENELESRINSTFKTTIRIQQDKIDLWKSQFINSHG